LRLRVLRYTRSIRRYVTKFVNKHVLCKKQQCKVAKQCKSNPKKFWKYVNNKSKSQSKIGNIKTFDTDKNVSVANNDEDKANIFGDYFSGVYTQESVEEFKELYFRLPYYNVSFSQEVVLDKLNNLKLNKSSGPDTLHPHILYEVRHQIAMPLHMIFQTSYNIGLIPREWKFYNTVPIYKKGSKDKASNYRPVNLTTVIC